MKKEISHSEYIAGMREYSKKIKQMSIDDSKNALIRIGVLNSKGNPKKRICSEEYYLG